MLKQPNFCRVSSLVAVLLLVLAPGESYAAEQKRGQEIAPQPAAAVLGQYRALIIGINDYRHWIPLRFAESDASEISKILVEIYGFDPGKVVSLLGEDATESRILSELHGILRGAGEKDNIFIYFAGHGQLDRMTETGYWIPVEGLIDDESTWIPFSTVQTLLKAPNLRAKNVLVVTDSCYGGALARSGPTPGKLGPDQRGYERLLLELASRPSRQVIASGGFEVVPDKSHFAELFKTALRDNRFRLVDLEHLFHSEVLTQLRFVGQQAPVMARLVTAPGEDGQFVLSRQEPPKSPVPSVTNAFVGSSSDPLHNLGARAEISFWESIRESKDADLLEDYLKRWPGGLFEMIARKRLAELGASEIEGAPVDKTPAVHSLLEVRSKPAGNDNSSGAESRARETPAGDPSDSLRQDEGESLSGIEQASTWTEKATLATRHLEQFPQSSARPYLLQILALAALEREDVTEFVRNAEASLKELPENLSLLIPLAVTLADQNLPDRAISFARQAEGVLGRVSQPQMMSGAEWQDRKNQLLADILYAQGRANLGKATAKSNDSHHLAMAIKQLEQAVRLNPTHDYATFRLAYAYSRQKQWEAALEFYARTVAIGQAAAPQARTELDALYRQLNRTDQGLEDLIAEQKTLLQTPATQPTGSARKAPTLRTSKPQ